MLKIFLIEKTFFFFVSVPATTGGTRTRFESDAFSSTGLSPSLVSRSRAVQLTL
jgi:hypothetical protein